MLSTVNVILNETEAASILEIKILFIKQQMNIRI